jgi:hypothetical protein
LQRIAAPIHVQMTVNEHSLPAQPVLLPARSTKLRRSSLRGSCLRWGIETMRV